MQDPILLIDMVLDQTIWQFKVAEPFHKRQGMLTEPAGFCLRLPTRWRDSCVQPMA